MVHGCPFRLKFEQPVPEPHAQFQPELTLSGVRARTLQSKCFVLNPDSNRATQVPIDAGWVL